MNKVWHDLELPEDFNPKYNKELVTAYAPVIVGLGYIFDKGIVATTVGEEDLVDTESMFNIIRQEVSLPEHYHQEDIPQISNGGKLKAILNPETINEGQRNKTLVTLRNTYSSLLTDPEKGEMQGEIATAICYTLFKNGWVPFDKVFRGKNRIVIKSLELNLVDVGDVFIEISLVCKNKCKVEYIPTDDYGRPDITAVEEIIDGKKMEE